MNRRLTALCVTLVLALQLVVPVSAASYRADNLFAARLGLTTTYQEGDEIDVFGLGGTTTQLEGGSKWYAGVTCIVTDGLLVNQNTQETWTAIPDVPYHSINTQENLQYGLGYGTLGDGSGEGSVNHYYCEDTNNIFLMVDGALYNLDTGEELEPLEEPESPWDADIYNFVPSCEFDPTTGTILKVLEDVPLVPMPEEYGTDLIPANMVLPDSIDGVTVTAIAPYAIDGLETVLSVFVPETVLSLTGPIARDCSNLCSVLFLGSTSLTCMVVENCPSMGIYAQPYEEMLNTVLPLFTSQGILQGTGSSLDLDGTFTRAQAVTILMRLAGLEEEGLAYTGETPFTDLPDWAAGTIGLAYEMGMTQGTSATTFSPDDPCNAQAFITMLLRLTELEEGVDYSWETALQVFQQSLADRGLYSNVDTNLTEHIYMDFDFTRSMAIGVIYRMLSMRATDSGMTFADLLVESGGLDGSYLCDLLSDEDTYFDARGYIVLTLQTIDEITDDRGIVTLELSEGYSFSYGVVDNQAYFAYEGEEGTNLRVGYTLDGAYESFTILPGESMCLTVPEGITDLHYNTYWAKSSQLSNTLYWNWEMGMPTLRTDISITYYYSLYLDDENRPETLTEEYLDSISPDIAQKAQELVAGISSDYEKVETIATWVAEHVYYDWDGLYAGELAINQSSDRAFTEGLAVCGGYANLTKEMLSSVGIPTLYVRSRDHAWNESYVDGRWVIFDTTFMSGNTYQNGEFLSKSARMNYFDISIGQATIDHGGYAYR